MTPRQPAILLALTLAALLGTAWPAAAQKSIPHDVITATGSFGPEAQDAISQHVDRWGGVLQAATADDKITDKQITEARDLLLNPIKTPGVTVAFKKVYSKAVTDKLKPLFGSERLAVRLNAMLVGTRLADKSVIDFALATGMSDKSPAVRYWAAKTLGNLSDATDTDGEPLLETRDRLNLLRKMAEIGSDETSTQVLKQIFEAMVKTNLPSTPDRVLALLSTRLKFHVARPYEPYLAENAAMRAVYRQLLDRSARGTLDTEDARQLAGIAQRYMNLVSDNLADAKELAKEQGSENPISQELAADHAEILKICDAALHFCYAQAGSSEPKPKQIDSQINFKQWREIHTIAVEEWGEKVLRKAPFSFQPAELAIVGN